MTSKFSTAQHHEFRRQMAEIVEGHAVEFDGDDPWWAIAATERKTNPAAVQSSTAATKVVASQRKPCSSSRAAQSEFVPLEPESLSEAGITESQIEALILKFLSNRAAATGREIAEQIKLPLRLLQDLLHRMKEERLVVYKGAAPMSDYLYELTELGCDRAVRYARQSTYFGAAAVSLEHYVASVHAQSIRKRHPRMDAIRAACADLLLSQETLSQLGQAVNSGLGLFLYGAPGNGKTSIAERLTKAFGEGLWIPRAICASGELVRLYDPILHQALPIETASLAPDTHVDKRWIYIRRPTVVVGGELTLDHLEIAVNKATGVNEAPLQLKSNGGSLVIDDFGRQRLTPAELLNRWILPLEKRYDYLNLAAGRRIQVPFDQLLIFSTNLEPRSLVDEAFLRRIPYKIDVKDPSEADFRELLQQAAAKLSIECPSSAIDYLLEKHYKASGRPMRFCHARDLLHQVAVYCGFHEYPLVATHDAIDAAVKNYFAMM